MRLKDIIDKLFVPGTDSENRFYTIRTYFYDDVLWKGKAIDIKKWNGRNQNRNVVEILVDPDDDYKALRGIPRYNWNKIIIVM